MGEAKKDSTSACQVAASFIITATVSLKDAETRKTLETVSHYQLSNALSKTNIAKKVYGNIIFFNILMDTTHKTTIKWLYNNNNNNNTG